MWAAKKTGIMSKAQRNLFTRFTRITCHANRCSLDTAAALPPTCLQATGLLQLPEQLRLLRICHCSCGPLPLSFVPTAAVSKIKKKNGKITDEELEMYLCIVCLFSSCLSSSKPTSGLWPSVTDIIIICILTVKTLLAN